MGIGLEVTKQCSKCKAWKDIGEFSIEKSSKDGHARWCGKCKKEYREVNKERLKQWFKTRYLEDKDRLLAMGKSWRERNKERLKNLVTSWRAKNSERNSENQRRWRKENPQAHSVHERNRRARKRDAFGEHSAEQITDLYLKQRGRCAACDSMLHDEYHADHIYALSIGGSNDILNIQLLCQNCNLVKHAKDPIRFMQDRGFLI